VDRKIACWTRDEGQWGFHNALFGSSRDVMALAFGRGQLISGGPDGSLRLWDEHGRQSALPPFRPQNQILVTGGAPGHFLVGLHEKAVDVFYLQPEGPQLWHAKAGPKDQGRVRADLPDLHKLLTVQLAEDAAVRACAVASDASLLAIAGSAGLRLFGLDLAEIQVEPLRCPDLDCSAVAFAEHPHRALWAAEVVADGARLKAFRLSETGCDASDVLASHDVPCQVELLEVCGKHVAAAGLDTVHVLSTQGSFLDSLPRHDGRIVSLDFLRPGQVCVATTTHAILVYDLKTKERTDAVVPAHILPTPARILGAVGLTASKLLVWTADAMVKVDLHELQQPTGAADTASRKPPPFQSRPASAFQLEKRFRWTLGCRKLPQAEAPRPAKKAKVQKADPIKLLVAEMPEEHYLRLLQPPFERKRYGT